MKQSLVVEDNNILVLRDYLWITILTDNTGGILKVVIILGDD